MTHGPSDAAAVLAEFDKFIRDANGVPFTDQVRLDRRKIDVLLDRLRTALTDAPAEMMEKLDQLDELVQRAHAIPLTNEIRIERPEIYDLLDQLRMMRADSMTHRGGGTALNDAPSDLVAVLDELDELVHNAKAVPLTTQIRLDRLEIYELLDRLRVGIGSLARGDTQPRE